MPVTEPPLIARLVRETRQSLRLTQGQFAVKLGVLYQTVNRWENRRTTPLLVALKLLEGMLRQIGDRGKDCWKSILRIIRQRHLYSSRR